MKRPERRNHTVQTITLAVGTLKVAVSNVNIGDGIEGCKLAVDINREIARTQIARLREALDKIEGLLEPGD